VSFIAITPCVAFQRMFFVTVVYFVIDSVRKRLDTACVFCVCVCVCFIEICTHVTNFTDSSRGLNGM
jgi:hypothetical protein